MGAVRRAFTRRLLAGGALWLALAAGAHAQGSDGYVGEARCITCHRAEEQNWAHTIHAAAFRRSAATGLEAKGCEACHGPGAKHLEDATNKASIIAFTHRRDVPVATQNAQCLQCHKGRERIFWEGSIHASSQLGCSDCHNPMARISRTGLLARESVSEACFTCHAAQRTEFRKKSHMPLAEGRMSCSDCHNPHGSATRPLLKADTVNQLCYGCHAEKRGPYLWEHAPVRKDCLNCHVAHGSSHESLLVVARPFLCQQCHAQVTHPAALVTRSNLPRGARPDERAVNRSCSNCHSQVHGSNHPSGSRFQR